MSHMTLTVYINHECPDCDGSGINNAGNGDCFHCGGTGTDPDERCVDCHVLPDEAHERFCHALDECPHCGVNVYDLGGFPVSDGYLWICDECKHPFTEPRRVRGDFDSRMTRAIASGMHAATVAGK